MFQIQEARSIPVSCYVNDDANACFSAQRAEVGLTSAGRCIRIVPGANNYMRLS